MRTRSINGRGSPLGVALGCAGFTLTELLVVLMVGGIVIGSMVSFFIGQAKGSRVAGVRLEAVQRGRFGTEMLRRETSLAGAGIPGAQPLVVFAGPDDFVFSADLTSSTPGDRVAVYQVPGAPAAETEGADSGSITLPNGPQYPQTWYGPSRTPGPAETIRFSFVADGDGEFAMVRAVNNLQADTLLRGLKRIGGRDFFSYQVMDAEGQMSELTDLPVWHEASIHQSKADTAESALADSIKIVEISFMVKVEGRRFDEAVERSFTMAVALNNAGLIQNAACGDPPLLGSVPSVELTALDPFGVTITWAPAIDEIGGERDVRQYTLYRREISETLARPIASIPPDPVLTTYSYVDNDVEAGVTYVYLLGATDCTPSQSDLAQSSPLTVPDV